MDKSAKPWIDELQRYRDRFQAPFEMTGKDVVKVYRAENKAQLGTKFNILGSNVATLKPALYAKPPKPEVSRRFKDKNPVARVASSIIERCLDYEITQFTDYDSALSNAVLDRLLPGRGSVWVRYEPVIDTVQISEDKDKPSYEKITVERTPVDYVYWLDFAHTPARTWEEVTWVARRVYLSLDEGLNRFGEVFRNVSLNHKPYQDNDERNKSVGSNLNKAVVWELWDKTTKKVVWFCEDYDEILDWKNDPLNLNTFFPCPKPLFATLTTDSLVPRNDYSRYQDQAEELNRLTIAIDEITDMIKVRGVCAGGNTALESLLTNSRNGTLVPITNWQQFVEKGGLRATFELMPIEELVNARRELESARASVKQVIYEITGISDIIRGASIASETATAQNIKTQFASIRLGEMKSDVARFAKDLLCLKAEIICTKYQAETLVSMSGIDFTPEAQKNPQVVIEALQLLKTEPLRNFSVNIQNDTLVELDERAEQEKRTQFLSSVSPFLERAVTAGKQVPEMVPLLSEMLLFGIRGFKIGKSMESTFESTFEALINKQQEQDQGQGQSQVQAVQAHYEQQLQQLQTNHEQQLAAIQQSFEQRIQVMQVEQQKLLDNFNVEQLKANTQLKATEMQEANKLKIAELNAQTKLLEIKKSCGERVELEPELDENGEPIKESTLTDVVREIQIGQIGTIKALAEQMEVATNATISVMQENNKVLLETVTSELNRPKQLVRLADGTKAAIPMQTQNLN